MRRLPFFLLLLILSLVFAACSGGADENALATAEARAASAEAEAAAAGQEAAASQAEAAAAAAEAESAGAQAAAAEAAAAAAGAEAQTAEEKAAAAEAAAATAAAEAAAADARAAAAEEAAAAAMLMEGCEVDLSGETIVIHQHAGREGPLASILGDAFAFATADAISEINEAGGICGAQMEVVFRETQYDGELEGVAYEEARAYDPKPFLVLTYGSAATVVLHERVIEDEIVNFVAGLNGPAIYNPANGYTMTSLPIYSDQFAGFATWLSENWADVKPASAGDDIVIGVIGWAGAFGAGATTPEALAYIETLGNVTVLPLEEQAISPDADVTGQMQNLLLGGANVIWAQNLSFGTVQVIATARALGIWDDVIMSGVNWSNNIDVINILGDNKALADGYYAIYPHVGWNDIDNPGVKRARAAFGRGGYPESARSNTYLTTYASFFSFAEAIKIVIDEHGLEGLTGANFLAAFENNLINPLGIYSDTSFADGNRSGRLAQIRRATFANGNIEYVVAEDFFALPDTRPAP